MLHLCDAPMEALEAELRQHEQPTSTTHKLVLTTQLGPCSVHVTCPGASSAPGAISVTKLTLTHTAAPPEQPWGVRLSLHVRGAKGDEARNLGAAAWRLPVGLAFPSHFSFFDLPKGPRRRLMDWARVSRAVLDGFKLHATVMLLPDDEVGEDSSIKIPGGAQGTFAGAASALNGDFADVVIKAGGRTFKAHRVILAHASPALRGMLRSGMQEARAAEVELQDADSAAVQLLLTHIYGGEVRVPVALVPELYGLADQYQLRSDLGWQLRLWLSTVRMEAAALCNLLPAIHRVCPQACEVSLFEQAAKAGRQVVGMEGFGAWPLNLLVEVVRKGDPRTGFDMGLKWIDAQPRPAKQRHHWPRLLDAINWGEGDELHYSAIRRAAAAAEVPGLQERLLDECQQLCERRQAVIDDLLCTSPPRQPTLADVAALLAKQKQQRCDDSGSCCKALVTS